jgi:hypothetical protein
LQGAELDALAIDIILSDRTLKVNGKAENGAMEHWKSGRMRKGQDRGKKKRKMKDWYREKVRIRPPVNLRIKKALHILSVWVGFGWWELEDI